MKQMIPAILASLLALAACAPPGNRDIVPFNEASAIAALRTVESAQELYKNRCGKYGDFYNLNNGMENEYIDPVLARADPDHPRHRDRIGYNIDISVNSDNSGWRAFAYPGTWGTDGERNFKMTSDGVIYYNDTKGDTTNFTKVLGQD